MNARTFGRRGGSDGGVAARRTPSFGLKDEARPASETEEQAIRREAFLAEEHARGGVPSSDETLAYEVTSAAVSEAVWGKPKSLPVAYALWLFVGLFGAHRFYLGRYFTGALQAMLGIASWSLLSFEYYPAFIGMALALIWMSADAWFVRKMHARPPG